MLFSEPAIQVPGMPAAVVIDFPRSLSERGAESATGNEPLPRATTRFCRPRLFRPVMRSGWSAGGRPVR